uniref:Ectonucleoside triphosphate diphosphohydrolase 4 n=1 Tax=Hemiscolopendra marginata TaxID=943146 RepID=A0A646QD70_9MYRI
MIRNKHCGSGIRWTLCFGLVLTAFLIYSVVKDNNSHTYKSIDPNETLEDLRYAVIIDAGSSGSRVFIYVWPPHTGNPKELLNIFPLKDHDGNPSMKKIEPGLSSSVGKSAGAATDYIAPLLDFAVDIIPKKHHKETPLYILATAGMRLLNSSLQASILDDLRTNIPKRYSFSFTENSAEVISGTQEGIYQWISMNYILGRFDHKSDAPLVMVDIDKQSSESPVIFRKQTVGIMDMGGASMQIAFEITSKVQYDMLHERSKENIAEFNLGCLEHGAEHMYRTYVTTYLGLGANEALEYYNDYLISSAMKNISNGQVRKNVLFRVHDPCRPLDYVQRINRTVPISGSNETTADTYIIFHLKGTGNFDKCRETLRLVLTNLTGCPGSACVLNQLPIDFSNSQFYGFSEFWYSMEDVLRIGGKYHFYTFQKEAKAFCTTRWPSLEKRYRSGLYPLADLHRFQTQCFKSSWLTVVLHEGLGFSKDYLQLQSSPNTIGGKVAHWTLGAALYRTRFFPLGDIQRETKSRFGKSTYPVYMVHLNYLFVPCFMLVVGAIIIYLRRLHCLHPNHVVNLRTFSHSKADDPDLGLLIDRNSYSR